MAKFKVDTKTAVKTRRRFVGDKIVTPVMYDGHHLGHGGQYMSGSIEGELVSNKNGKPLPLNQIGILQ